MAGEVFTYINEYKEKTAVRTRSILSMRVAKSGNVEITTDTGFVLWAGENIDVLIYRWENAEHSMHE